MSQILKSFVTGLALVAIAAGASFGQDAKLVEAGKKEGGKVVIYGSLESDR